jgi:5-methylthioadenosine/S-adenosylhomocysteine deaminase
LLLRVKAVARERGRLLHVHTAQGERETIQIEGRYGTRPVAFLDSIGYLDEQLLAVHLTDATEEEAALVARRGARMILCSGSIGIIDGIVPRGRSGRRAGWWRWGRIRPPATIATTCSMR